MHESLAPTQTNKILATNAIKGLSICRGLDATYAKGWLIMVGASRTSPVPGNVIRRRHARPRILPSFGALRGDNTPIAALRGLRMITRAK